MPSTNANTLSFAVTMSPVRTFHYHFIPINKIPREQRNDDNDGRSKKKRSADKQISVPPQNKFTDPASPRARAHARPDWAET